MSEDVKKVIYIADLDDDVDDIVAIEYLHDLGVLDQVVLDPLPRKSVGKQREKMIEKMGISISTFLPKHSEYVFNGGAMTIIANSIKNGCTIGVLVMNGGFVGCSLVSEFDQLPKFRNKETVRTYNFNCDVESTDFVLKTNNDQIGEIVLVGKNVCHSDKNTSKNFWSDKRYEKYFKKYNIRDDKKMHDLLACREGLALANIGGVTVPWCTYGVVKPYNKGLDGNMTQWGSLPRGKYGKSPYREVIAAVKLAR